MEREMNKKWGTWEELVLGSAVKRHGTNNWESVAMELQARKLSPYVFSSQDCKVKYHALQGRFNNTCSHSNSMPWLEELRKLRVAHLKRELERYDDSIVSLESKLKRLKAEKEPSSTKEEQAEEGSPETVKVHQPRKPQDLGLGKADLKSANPTHDLGSQGEQDPLQLELPLSVPHNNSASKSEVEVGGCGPASPLDSYYGSSDTIAKEHPHRTIASEAEGGDGREEDFVESTDVHSETIDRKGDGFQEGSAESREIGEEEEEEEEEAEEEAGKRICEKNGDTREGLLQPPWDTSDVLSSAEFSTRRRRRDKDSHSHTHSHSHSHEDEDVGGHDKDGGEDSVGGWKQQQHHQRSSGESQGEGTDDMSPMSKRSRREAKVPGKLLPFLECLRAISAHKFGSIFKHRLDSQDNMYYKSIIRRHMDLAMVRSRLEEGSYSGSVEFFRDVLLVFNNALVYYPKYSQEFVAAYVLRELASKEMANIFQTEALLKQEGPSTRKREPRKGSELKPIIVCRKRNASGEKQSLSSAVAAVEMQQSDSGKEIEMKDAEFNEIKTGKGKVEGPKVTATAPVTHNLDTKLQQKTQDANSFSKTGNAILQSKSESLSRGLKKRVLDTQNPIKNNADKALSLNLKKGGCGSSSINDMGKSSSEVVAPKKSSNGAIRAKKSSSVGIEAFMSESKKNSINMSSSASLKEEEVGNLKQSMTANAAQPHPPLKRGVGRPPKHAKLPSQQKHHHHQPHHSPHKEAAESELLVSKPRKRARK